MLKKIANYLRGYLKIRITGYSPERFLNLCKNKGIEIWGLESKANAYEMFVTVRDFRKLKPLLRKTRNKIVIVERYGTPFFFHHYRKRKVFFCGIFFCIILIEILSKFIWNIEIGGNSTITDEELIEYLVTEDVFHGMKIKDVNCEEISTNIRKNFNEIIWVSVSLDGTNIRINVKENTDTFQVSNTEESPSDIIATEDGVITEIITRSGVPCVKKGDKVKAGDVLVSGIIEVKNDAGEVVREDYKQADADVYAQVTIAYEDFCKTLYEKKSYNKDRHKLLYIRLFNYQLSLGIKKNNSENYEIDSKEIQLRLGKNFELPISYGLHKGKGYQLIETERSKEEKLQFLNDNLLLFCQKLEENEIQILEKQITYQEVSNGIRAAGTIKALQTIGTQRKMIDFQ